MKVIKKNGEITNFDAFKIINAVNKSAERVLVKFSSKELDRICFNVEQILLSLGEFSIGEFSITVSELHNIVEKALEMESPTVARSYREYRNYKVDFVGMLDEVYNKAQKIMYLGDKDNSNTDSALVSTKRSLIYNELNKELYNKFFLNIQERQACVDGYIYIHDKSARRDTMNCFAKETRFITDRGVKSFEDFKDGDEVKVPTHTGEWKLATVRNYGEQKLQKVVFKRGSKGEKEVYCTENHRWLLKNNTDTTNLSKGDKLALTPNISAFEWDDLTEYEKTIWVYGFCMGDGHTRKNSENSYYTNIRLCGDKSRYIDFFKDAGFTVTRPNCFNGDYSVHVPNFRKSEFNTSNLNHEEVKYFIHGLLSADGNRNLSFASNSMYRGIQVTGNLNEAIEDLLNISGYYVTRKTNLTNQTTNYGKRKDETMSYGFYSDQGCRGWVVQNIISTNRKETVWCLEVEDNHSFILENGIVTGNCCLFDAKTVMTGGFEMGNMWYNEPKSIDTACDVLGDIIMMSASMQYGGWSTRIDDLLAPYVEKSYLNYLEDFSELSGCVTDKIRKKALDKTRRDLEQGLQGLEYKLNSVASSRGDYPFTTFALGLGTTKFEQMVSEAALKVRMEGQGKEGKKKQVLFPKLVFLYDENLHGEGKELEYLFNTAIDCSSKAMYPDFLSLTGEGYVPSMYKKYKEVVYPMGCRAFLSPYYRKGGMEKLGEDDKPVFTGRFNIGAITLNLIMIYQKAKLENRDFYDILDYYLEMIRGLHLKTYEYLGEMKASTNPLAYCEGGFYGGNLKQNDKIKPILKSATASFGITGLNELQALHNGKSLVEDGKFAIQVMEYINNKIEKYKKEDNKLYAIYGTPAESLCGLQIRQFRNKYGLVENVSTRGYTSNSFHCGVWENINPIEKQDLEDRFWNLFNGGKIQYVRYPLGYNKEAMKTLVRRAMKKGFYEGINMALSYCDDCGYREEDMEECPICNSSNLTKIDRMNGYLSYSRVKGDTRLNDSKMEEISDRVSM